MLEAETEYAFEGRVIRLTRSDFERWQKMFHTIPDMAAELEAIDAWLAEERNGKNWFVIVSSLLNKRHQARALQRTGTVYEYDDADPATPLLKKHGIPPMGPAGY